MEDAFEPVRAVNISPGEYHYHRFEIYGSTNQSTHLGASVRFSTGGYFGRRLNSYMLKLRVAPSPYLTLQATYTRNDFKEFENMYPAVTTHLLTGTLRAAINPKILLSAFYQYNTNTQKSAWNTRLSWEYKPLSFVYFVLNSVNSYGKIPDYIPKHQDNGILKVTFIKQF